MAPSTDVAILMEKIAPSPRGHFPVNGPVPRPPFKTATSLTWPFLTVRVAGFAATRRHRHGKWSRPGAPSKNGHVIDVAVFPTDGPGTRGNVRNNGHVSGKNGPVRGWDSAFRMATSLDVAIIKKWPRHVAILGKMATSARRHGSRHIDVAISRIAFGTWPLFLGLRKSWGRGHHTWPFGN